MNLNLQLKTFVKDNSFLKTLYHWRSDPTTLAHSFRKTIETYDEFKKSFETKYHSIAHLPPQWLMVDEKAVGIVYYERGFKDREVVLSLYLDPSEQNRGYGRCGLKLASEDLLARGYTSLIAYVLEKNLKAQKAYLSAGFSQGELLQIFKYDQQFCGYRFEKKSPKASQIKIIAEVGSNCTGGDEKQTLEMAMAYIQEAYRCGATAVKFQLFSSQKTYVSNAGTAPYLSQNINEIFERYALPRSLLPHLYDYARFIGIELMCSFFSPDDFEAIDPYVSCHKIASYEIRHIRLLQLAAQSKKPLFLSTGAATLEDIKWAKNTFLEAGGKELTLLHCTAQYPAKEQNLRCIQTLRETFNTQVGLSDHSLHPLYGPLAAIALGATTIEKHFTFSKKLIGPDHFFAVDPKEFKEMCEGILEVEQALGVAKKEIFAQEEELATIARRGLQAIREINPGEPFKEGYNVAILRPGMQRLGIHPKYVDVIEGKVAQKKIALGDGLQKEDILWE